MTTFILKMDSRISGTSPSNQVILPIGDTARPGISNAFDIDWGDGNTELGNTTNGWYYHTYTIPGEYTITIKGDIVRPIFDYDGDRFKVTELVQWGGGIWYDPIWALSGCANMIVTATDSIKLVGDCSGFLDSCPIANAALDKIDVSDATSLYGFFWGDSGWDAATWDTLQDWDVSKVESLSDTFHDCTNADPTIHKWQPLAATTMANLLTNTAFSDISYSNTLLTWSKLALQSTVPVSFGAASANGDLAGEIAALESNGWTIASGVLGAVSPIGYGTLTRNYYLASLTQAYGVLGIRSASTLYLLRAIVIAAGGIVTSPATRDSLLNDYLEAIGGSRIVGTRNAILRAIISQLGSGDTPHATRNNLLILWEGVI